MILDIILGYLALVLTVTLIWIWAALRRHRRPLDHSHDVRLPDMLTRDHWRDRGRQDPLSEEEWSECERNRGFVIPNNSGSLPLADTETGPAINPPKEYWTTVDPTPDEPWITTQPERGALVLVKMKRAAPPHHPIIYASLSVTGMYLYAIDGTVHRWADALGWKIKPDKMAPFMNGGWRPGDVQETST
jgi:hypothetical protein